MKKARTLLLAAAAMTLAATAHAQEFINVLTGGTSGVYYPLGVALSQIYGKAIPGAKTSVQATKASAENLNLLQAGRGEIAFTLGDALNEAWKGNEEAGFKTPLKKLRTIAAIYPNYIQIVANAESGIKTLADLKGKRVAVGAPKSGTELNARDIFKGAGMSYKDFGQGRVPALRRVGRTDEEPPARRHADFCRPRRGRDARPGHGGEDRRRADSRRRREQDRRSRLSGRHRSGQHLQRPDHRRADRRRPELPGHPRRRFHRYSAYKMTKAMFEHLPELHAAHAAAKAITKENAAKAAAGALASGRREVLQEVGLIK
jgi:TRAP-type uncharacterized transport system substrate-binding protein